MNYNEAKEMARGLLSGHLCAWIFHTGSCGWDYAAGGNYPLDKPLRFEKVKV